MFKHTLYMYAHTYILITERTEVFNHLQIEFTHMKTYLCMYHSCSKIKHLTSGITFKYVF